MQKRILQDVIDDELTLYLPKEIAEKYFVSRTTVLDEIRRRGLKCKRTEPPQINISLDDLKEKPIVHLIKREKTTANRIYKYIFDTYNLTGPEVTKMRKEHFYEKTRLDKLTDDELRKPMLVLIKEYSTTQYRVKEEREKRGIKVGSNRFLLSHVSDEDLFNLPVSEIAKKFGVSASTISLERYRRNKLKDPGHKKQKRNVLSNVSDSELLNSMIDVLSKKYGVSHSAVYRERAKRRESIKKDTN